LKESLEEFVNKEPIREVVSDILVNDKYAKKEQHGTILHAATSMYPNNLVRGPLPEKRGDDLKHKIDKKILELQPHEFQDRVDKFDKNPTFKNFANLPPSTPVSWKETKSGSGKYVVDQPQQVILI